MLMESDELSVAGLLHLKVSRTHEVADEKKAALTARGDCPQELVGRGPPQWFRSPPRRVACCDAKTLSGGHRSRMCTSSAEISREEV